MAQPAPSRPDAARRTSTMNKRTSILPKHTALFIDPSVLVAQHAGFTGTQPITVGPNAVLHPHAKVSSSLAPVVIGENVVLWERAKIGVGMGDTMDESKRSSVASMASRASVRDSMRGEGTVLGRNVTVEATAVVEAAEVGEGTIIEVGAYVGKGCVIGKVSGALQCWTEING
jgi:dynactin-6